MIKILSGRWIKRLVVLVSLLCFTGVSAPAPAYAAVGISDAIAAAQASEIYQTIATWGQKLIDGLTDLLASVVNFANILWAWFNYHFDVKAIVTIIQMATDSMMAKIDIALAEAKSDANTIATFMGLRVENFTDKTMFESKAVARAVFISQGPTAINSFRTSVGSLALSAIDTSYRGKGKDGAGPAYAADDFADRCSSGRAGKDYPDNCEHSSLTGDLGQPYTDSDLTVSTISGGQTLELAKFEPFTDSNGNTFNEVAPENTEQKFWDAALAYCDHFAGPRPTPPINKQLDTVEGRTRAAKWNTCAARRSNYARACTTLLADNTRPNSEQAELIEQQKARCDAAEALGISLPDSFDNCEKGLSPAQERFLTKALCMSPEFYMRRSAMAEAYPEMKDSTIDCMNVYDKNMQIEATMSRTLTIAAGALIDLQRCWGEVEALH